jgi:hypothetical protein
MPASDSAPAEDTRGPDTKRQKLAGMQSEQEESICDQPSQNLSKLSTSELKALLHALHAAGRSEDLPLDTTGREGMIAALQAVVDEFKPAQVRCLVLPGNVASAGQPAPVPDALVGRPLSHAEGGQAEAADESVQPVHDRALGQVPCTASGAG